jgi:hypothetical protein
MGQLLKLLIALGANAIAAGFFGLACSLLNLLWLEFAVKHWPGVSYSPEYTYRFGTFCAGAFGVIALLRLIQSRLAVLFPKTLDASILFAFILIAMVGFTPVPHSHFLKYLSDRNSVVKTTEQPWDAVIDGKPASTSEKEKLAGPSK